MGAQQSVNLSCVVDRLTHAPGEDVKGNVFVQINNEELSKFEGVTVTLVGIECITNPETGEILPGSRKITITQDIVHFKNGKITKGDYEFPFSLALPFDPVAAPAAAHVNKKELKYSSTLPALIQSKSDSSVESSEQTTSDNDEIDDDDLSTVSDPTNNLNHMPKIHHKQIMFQIKASLKRKPGVPITVDTDFRCKARSANDIMVQ